MAHDHEDESEHECGKCGQIFETDVELKSHAKEEHDMDV